MQVQKSHLESFFQALKGTEGVLSLKESRVRDSFIKSLAEALETFYKERTAIYQAYCLTKEDGTCDIKDDKYHFPPEKLPDINQELQTLHAEEVELDTPAGLKEIMEKTTYAPKVGEAELIDAVLAKL